MLEVDLLVLDTERKEEGKKTQKKKKEKKKKKKVYSKGLFFFISILYYVDLVNFGPFGTAISELRVRSSDKKIRVQDRKENGTNREKKKKET